MVYVYVLIAVLLLAVVSFAVLWIATRPLHLSVVNGDIVAVNSGRRFTKVTIVLYDETGSVLCSVPCDEIASGRTTIVMRDQKLDRRVRCVSLVGQRLPGLEWSVYCPVQETDR